MRGTLWLEAIEFSILSSKHKVYRFFRKNKASKQRSIWPSQGLHTCPQGQLRSGVYSTSEISLQAPFLHMNPAVVSVKIPSDLLHLGQTGASTFFDAIFDLLGWPSILVSAWDRGSVHIECKKTFPMETKGKVCSCSHGSFRDHPKLKPNISWRSSGQLEISW